MKSYFSFQWHITDESDQRYKHCYIFSGEGCKELKTMTWKQMQEVVANCEDFCKIYNRVPYFYITGGEVDTGMTPQEYRRLLEICDAKFKAYEAAGCETYFNKKDHLWTLYEYETGQFKLPENACDGMIYGGCNCGNCHITIASNGDIMACRRVTDSRVANIWEDRLADVWICQMEKYRDYDKFKKCSKCELKAWCRGCPAVANGTTGGIREKGADTEKQGVGTFWAFLRLYFSTFVRYDRDRKCIYRLSGEGICTKESFTIK